MESQVNNTFHHEDIDTNSKSTEELESIFDIILSYMEQINRLQMQFHPLIEAAKGSECAEVFSKYSAEADKIYAQLLTKRKRTLNYGITYPPRFIAVSRSSRHTVEVDKNRAVATVYTETEGNGGLDYQFRLVKKDGEWLMNSIKQRYHSSDRTIEYQWQNCYF